MKMYSKPTNSKRYVSNHPKPCLKEYSVLSSKTHVCVIAEDDNVRYMKLKEVRTILKTQKYPKMSIEQGIEKALLIPQEQLRSEKLKNNNILPFRCTYNPNNSNVLSKANI